MRKLGAIGPALRALPWVLRARRAVRRSGDLPTLLGGFDGAPRGQPRPVGSAGRGVDAALRIVGPRHHACVPRSLALLGLLSSRGQAATLVSGVRRGPEGVVSHAWVLVDGVPVGEPAGLAGYVEHFRYDNAATRGRGQGWTDVR